MRVTEPVRFRKVSALVLRVVSRPDDKKPVTRSPRGSVMSS